MSKNKKVIFASVGVLLALILAVLMIRSPVEREAPPEPTQVQVVTPAQEQTPQKEMDESHKKIAGLIDDASAAVVKEAPGLWGRIVDTWNWLMAFDAKYAIILIAVMVFVFGLLATGGRNKTKSS